MNNYLNIQETESKVRKMVTVLACLEEVQGVIKATNDTETLMAGFELSQFVTNKVVGELDDLAMELMNFRKGASA